MSKKGMALSTIIGFIMLLLLLGIIIVYIIGPDAVLPQAAKAADWIADKTYGSIRKDKFEKPAVETDKSMESVFENILSILRSGGGGPCIVSYKQFPNDFNGFKIKLSSTGEGILVQLINKQGQYIDPKTVSGKSLCVVGEGAAAQNFYDNYLDGTVCKSYCKLDYSIISDIEFRGNGKIYVNGRERGLDDGNLVFKTNNGNVCFFPTKRLNKWPGCDASEEGLDNDCIEEINTKIKKC